MNLSSIRFLASIAIVSCAESSPGLDASPADGGSADGGASPADGGSSPDSGITRGEVSLRVIRAAATDVVDSTSTRLVRTPGSRWITVDLELANGTAAPAPLAVPLFTIETSIGLEYFGAVQTFGLRDGCPQSASVSVDRSARCTVLFEIPAGDSAIAVRYRRVDGQEARAELDVVACHPCGALCVDVGGNDPKNCGRCDTELGEGECEAGQPLCASGLKRCESACVDTANDPNNCGRCGAQASAAKGEKCLRGEIVCRDSDAIRCDGACVSARSDDHCGVCSRACTQISAHCEESASGPLCVTEPSPIVDCDTSCGELTCAGARFEYYCKANSNLALYLPCSSSPAPFAVAPDGQRCDFESGQCWCR